MNSSVCTTVSNLLVQLEELLQQLDDDQYQQRIPVLSGATLGQHTRHILEFFIELQEGYETGLVNYDRRKRDHRIETSRFSAIGKIRDISYDLAKPNKEMTLTFNADLPANTQDVSRIPTNYYRELVYNLEHLIHHMALLRIGVEGISGPTLPDSFGVAASTLKYKLACAP